MNAFLKLLLGEWGRSSRSQQRDPSFSLDLVARVCAVLVDKGKHYVVEEETYTGYHTVSRILKCHGVPGIHRITLINQGVFDVWQAVVEHASGKRFVNDGMDALFPIEFATNLKKYDGHIVLVSQKMLCFDASQNVPLVMMEYGSEGEYVPDMNILDFVWNVLFLKLSTPKDLITWTRSENSSTLFLDETGVNTLIAKGVHEVYAKGELDDTAYALMSIAKIIDAMYSSIKTVQDCKESNEQRSENEEIDIE